MNLEKNLFVNGIYEEVLKEIINAQSNSDERVFYLQPHSGKIISELKKFPPGPDCKWLQYASTTKDLKHIHYVTEIIGWENKRELSPERFAFIEDKIKVYQPGEIELFRGNEKEKCINLLSITNLRKIPNPIPVGQVYKISNGHALQKRTRSGGWSYVHPLLSDSANSTVLKIQFDKDFEKEVRQSQQDSHEQRMARLEIAPRIPSKTTAVSVVFKRNPDVVAEVLNRANGHCELCRQAAPFIKASDGKPYLEVHHWKFLSENGEDTVANSAALCPNCHKRAHFSKSREFISINHKLPF